MLLRDKEEKLLRLALDPAAGDGEWRNCAHKLVASWRRRGFRAEALVAPPPPPSPPPPPASEPDYGLCIMPWGKYKGRELRAIPPDYLEYILNWIENEAEHSDRLASVADNIREFLQK